MKKLLVLAPFIFIGQSANALDGNVMYERFFRLNEPVRQSDSGDWIGTSFKTKALEKRWDWYSEGDLRLYFQDNNSFNYSLQELYTKYEWDNANLSVGRKLLNWNENEKYWGLGYLNAEQGFALLGEEQEGVSAAIFQYNYKKFQVDFLLSYFFIPQLNPGVKIENGQAKSQSEWARVPPKNTILNDRVVPIYYKLRPINYSDIIFRKSIGANVAYKWSKNGGLNTYALYKPENRLRANADAYYDKDLDKVVVEADPVVNHHALVGVQLHQDIGDLHTIGGLDVVDPNAKLGNDFKALDLIKVSDSRKTFKSDYFKIEPKYDRESYSHFAINYTKPAYSLSLNYIHLLSKNTRTNDDFFSDSVRWSRAFGLRAELFLSDSFSILGDMKYDIERYDNIIKSEIKYNYQNQMTILMGLEMLKAPKENSYWAPYRANDSVYSSVGFFF